MDVTEQTQSEPAEPLPQSVSGVPLTPPDRRADIERKQTRIASLLQEVGCEGLLVLDQENVAWLTAGGAARGVPDDESCPSLYFTPEGRWLLSPNFDTQRLFDEEIDGLGFQVKEWPWHGSREQFLADLCQTRNLACDRALGTCTVVGPQLRKMRLTLSDYEQACMRALGQIISHALEATCRTMARGETEREVAGQLSHRLLHRGATPLIIAAATDGRSLLYRQGGFTAAPVQSYCVLTVLARKYGLCARASRSVCFGQAEANFRKDHDAACKISATYIAGSWPDSVPRQILLSGRRVYQLSGVEHEWRHCPQGHLTGRGAVEMPITPSNEELLQAGWAVTWHASVGAAVCCDTFLITDEGPRDLTMAENWPQKRIRIQGAEFVRPDLLVR